MTIIRVKVQPGASKNEIVGMRLDMLKVKVTAQPESGKANKSCIELLANELGVAKNRIQIVKGHKSRDKQIQINGLTETELFQRLGQSRV